MAAATKYYYNKGKYTIEVRGDDNKSYYAPPRAHFYIPNQFKGDYVKPAVLMEFALPVWWKDSYWPKARPWWPSYDPWPSLRTLEPS